MKTVAYKQVNVFSEHRFKGNPVGVCLNGSHLDSEAMQLFALWTNLSETTFLLPPKDPAADYRVRIFTPSRELPFAGHPTLGSCFAWLHGGGVPHHDKYIIQECDLGLIKLKREGALGNELSFEAPEPLRMYPMEEEDVITVAEGLGINRDKILHHSWCDNGPKWRGVLLASMEEVLELKPCDVKLKGLDVGVIGPAVTTITSATQEEVRTSSRFDYEVRAFCDEGGIIVEDPVTGSLNAALAQWLMRSGLAPCEYVARQGTIIGRDGRVKLTMDADRKVWVSGVINVCIDGTVCI